MKKSLVLLLLSTFLCKNILSFGFHVNDMFDNEFNVGSFSSVSTVCKNGVCETTSNSCTGGKCNSNASNDGSIHSSRHVYDAPAVQFQNSGNFLNTCPIFLS